MPIRSEYTFGGWTAQSSNVSYTQFIPIYLHFNFLSTS